MTSIKFLCVTLWHMRIGTGVVRVLDLWYVVWLWSVFVGGLYLIRRWGCFILIDRTLGGSEISSALCLLWFFFDDGRHIDIAVMFQIMEKLTHPLGYPKGCVNFKCNG